MRPARGRRSPDLHAALGSHCINTPRFHDLQLHASTLLMVPAVAVLAMASATYVVIPEVYGPVGPYVERLAIVATALSLILAPGIYFLQKAHDRRDERSRASGSLYLELDDALNGLDENKQDDLREVELKNHHIYFMNRILNHGFYDSLISSGKITFIRPELQQPIQDTFQHIIGRNETLYKIRELEESGAQAESAHPHYESLARYEEYLINSIPKIMRELEKEYGIPSADKLRRLDSPSTA